MSVTTERTLIYSPPWPPPPLPPELRVKWPQPDVVEVSHVCSSMFGNEKKDIYSKWPSCQLLNIFISLVFSSLNYHLTLCLFIAVFNHCKNHFKCPEGTIRLQEFAPPNCPKMSVRDYLQIIINVLHSTNKLQTKSDTFVRGIYFSLSACDNVLASFLKA